MIQDTSKQYGIISRFFHWAMALAFFFILGTAIAWTLNEDYFSLIDWHKSIGFLLLLAVFIRSIWSIKNRSYRPHNQPIAHFGHFALYLLMFAIPLIGLLRQYGSARSNFEVFGLHIMDKAPEKITWMTQIGNNWHGKLGWVFFALIAGHIAMAIIHQIKGEKIINRMAGK